MPGTKHFGRMQYNVARGLREIVAPRQTMSRAQWEAVLEEFGRICIFCGSPSNEKNRGIVPDHLVPVTRFGELVMGNTVPACQTCNDSRGEKEWRPFLRQTFTGDAETQIRRVETHLAKFNYHPVSLEDALSPSERKSYLALLEEWEAMLEKAKHLRDSAAKRRRLAS
jgi:NMD protein affecting ribosome stability and mRNA decay